MPATKALFINIAASSFESKEAATKSTFYAIFG
jgi:hypothetical protein